MVEHLNDKIFVKFYRRNYGHLLVLQLDEVFGVFEENDE